MALLTASPTLPSPANYGEYLLLFQDSLLAAALLGTLGGLIGIFVIIRDLAFAVHGIAELSFAGGAFALFVGWDVVTGSFVGSLLAGLVLGALGVRARDRNSIIGVMMPFGLGLGILFLSLYKGRSSNKFGLLAGQLVAVDAAQLNLLIVMAAVVLLGLAGIWRPLMFASVEPEVAWARGVPLRGLSISFMLLLSFSVALSVQVVGALLVLALLVTPAAAAMQVTSTPWLVVLLSVAFALIATVGGVLLALSSTIPISPYVTSISFFVYVVCRLIRWRSQRRFAGRPA